ncbi:SDR family NAD(P)-dependent oxidoreductase [Pseudacidovorax intermedius]|uniref:SDR family NAD(P)-dependent oxidoreductase n=1 Tax=Pseudacidovorax intermedius TaxID=433924 RepID=UPI00034ABA28|nr:SDR family NAD(P)-dependent oxidoreductase [Pseudacidovorax intermedius]
MSLPALFDLAGRAVVVTGAASGLGLAIAEAMLQAGARTVMTDVDADALATEHARLQATHPLAESAVLDVTAPGAVDALIDDAVARHGALDCVFANAGISAGRGFMVDTGRLENLDMANWDRVLRINLDSVLVTVRAAARHMKPRGQGRIVVTSSIAGLRSEALSGYAYVASKAAVNNLVRQAAMELAPFNVLVNAIAPGPFATGINGGRLRLPESVERMRTYIPLGRVADPREIQGLALLLASPASSYMTGAIIPVDGGASAR